MSERQEAPKLDTRHAHSARVYNYWLGGKDNFAADREAAEQAIAANPGIVADVQANRMFLARAVLIPDADDPYGIVATPMDAMPAGR
jgi:S-adenosyl methyltransferase